MRTTLRALGAAVLALTAACGGGGGSTAAVDGGDDDSASVVDAGAVAPPSDGEVSGAGVELVAVGSLSARSVVPGPGADLVTGRVEVQNDTDGALCVRALIEGVVPATVQNAHLHAGGEGEAPGPVLVELGPPEVVGPETGSWDRCLPVEPASLTAMADGPSAFNLDVHTVDHPAGAARSQLTAATVFDLELGGR